MTNHLQNMHTLRQRALIIAIVLFLSSLTVLPLQANNEQSQTDAERVIEMLQASFADSDQHRFTAQIEQTLIPRATAVNIGKSEERVDSQLIGEITPDKSVLDWRFEGGGMPNILLEQVDGNTYLIQEGERTLIDSPLSATAPDGTFAGYLHAAANVVERHDPDYPSYTIYQFDIDGEAYGAVLAKQLRASLPANQQYGAVVPVRAVTMIDGVGEVWLDADGILRRQILDLDAPEVNEQYGSKTHIVIDYQYDNGASVVRGLPNEIVPLGGAELSPTQLSALPSPELDAELLFNLLVVIGAVLFAVVLLRRPRQLQVRLSIFLVFVFVSTPILQSVAYAAMDDVPQAPSLFDALNLQTETPQTLQTPATTPSFRSTTSLLTENEEICGVSDDRETDSDRDGLTDYVENCIGTSPYMVDTDGDNVGDMLEVTGFVFTDTHGVATTYYSNPFEIDSNLDGRSDLNEWAYPFGTSAKWDTDGDGQPNLWDIDDDGDNVSDYLDLSPSYTTVYSDYFRLKLEDRYSTFDGYQIIEFQVQPEDHEHLRYSTHALDWPEDHEGILQDKDNSTEDLTLTPFLKVITTQLPSAELMQAYGIQSFETETEGYYTMYIPLNPIGDGGRIDAFGGQAVYKMTGDGSKDGNRFEWRDSTLVWLAFFNQDPEEGESVGATSLIAEYVEERYRFSGLNISRQRNFDYAILGIPGSPADDLKLYQLMTALSASFLATEQVDLDSLQTRFEVAQDASSTWGLVNDVVIARAETPPGYLDALPVALGRSLVNYLSDANHGYPQDDLASLIVALEGETTVMSLAANNGTGKLYLDNQTLKGDARNVPMAQMRSLNMAFLDYEDNNWGEASQESMAELLTARYDFDAIAASLQGDYPDLDGGTLAVLMALSNDALAQGLQTMISYGDTVYVDLFADDVAIAAAATPLPGEENSQAYLLRVGGLAEPGQGIVLDDYSSFQRMRYDLPNAPDWTTANMMRAMIGYQVVKLQAGFVIGVIQLTKSIGGGAKNPNLKKIYEDAAVGAKRVQRVPQAAPVNPVPRSSVSIVVKDPEALDAVQELIDSDPDIIGNETTIGEEIGELAETDRIGEVDHAVTEGEIGADEFEIVDDVDGDGRIRADEFVVEGYDDTATPGFVDDVGVCGGRALRPANCGVRAADAGNNLPVRAAGAADDAVDAADATSIWVKMAPKLKSGAVKGLKATLAGLGVAGVAVDIVSIWLNHAGYQSIYDYERTEALVFAITVTVIVVVLELLSYIPTIGPFFVVFDIYFLLVDLVRWAANGDKSFSSRDEAVRALIEVFYEVDGLTRFKDFEFAGLEFVDFDTFLVGNQLVIKDQFTGLIDAAFVEGSDELANGESYGFFGANAESAALYVRTSYDTADCSEHPITPYGEIPLRQTCTNELRAIVGLEEAAINATFSLKYNARFKTRYQECVAERIGGKCTAHTSYVDFPEDLPAENQWDSFDLTIDILPATVGELWNWDALTNASQNDFDADGLTNSEETNEFGTNPNHWDSDGDTLSDGFEVSAGLNPNSADTDGDGLTDDIEVRIGTIATENGQDSDNDGLEDGREFGHYLSDGTWFGGGVSLTIDGNVYFVPTWPFTADLDQDNLNDGSEAPPELPEAGSSPHAENAPMPEVTFTSAAAQLAPDGRFGVFARQGDVISATLFIDNYAAALIDGVARVCIPDAGWVNQSMVVSSQTVNNLPATVIDGNCYTWDFDTTPLYQYQDFQAVFTGEIGTSGTITTPLSAEVPIFSFVDLSLSTFRENMLFTVDNTPPTIQVTAPVTNTRLAGDYYVMGGRSGDDLSWVDHVKVTVPSGIYTATGTLPWAYSWELPDDGIVTVSAVAYDAVGNASAPIDVQVTVDSLAPVITTSFGDGATIAAGESYSDTIVLSGTVSDNYSGVSYVQMAANSQPWRTIWMSSTPSTGPIPWSGVWELPAISETAQGEHALRLRAVDDFGNVSVLEQTVFVDLLPPTNEVTDRRFTADTIAHVPLSQPLTLQGVANDAGRNPIAAGPIPLEGTLDVIDDATIWLQPATYTEDDAGVTVAWIGDYDGDRLGDMAIGFPNGGDGRGKVVVVTGRAGGWPNPNLGDMELLSGKTPTFYGETGAGLGTTLAPAGDINGDGFADMLVGDLANNRLFLIYGTPNGGGSNATLDGVSLGRWDEISDGSETLTAQFAGAGDINGDSYADLLIATDTAVYLLAGGNPASTDDLGEPAAAVLTVGNASVAGVGDVNGDIVDDFAIASGNMVYLFSGSSSWRVGDGSSLSTDTTIASFATNDAAPTIIGAGDLNGDGFADFVFASGDNPVVVYGSDSGSYATETIGSGFAALPNGFLAAAGDTNKDGNSDLLVGNADGNAYLLLGGTLGTIAATIEGVDGSASAPYTKGADLAGDGSADLLLVPSAAAAAGSGFGVLGDARPALVHQDALPQRGGQTVGNRTTERNALMMTGDVTAGSADADFTGIQDAIDSGASRVLIYPGVYYEAITLTNNVEVIGSGAGLTTLMMPAGGSVLVSADGVTNTAVRNLTLKSDGTGIGIQAANGAAVDIERLLVEGLATGVAVDGATTNVDFKNNSFIDNVNGIAATNGADLDVRNTIFAYNTGTALAYDAGAAIQRHEFNLFYANGVDQTPNDPGSGEVFSNPLFLDYAAGDYRVEDISPVINAGSPGDVVPPGAGDIIDIGHIEQTGGGYVASQSYCSTCDNDGLIWGVTAFDTIQAAVDAAEEDLLNLFGGTQLAETGSQFVVGVDAGTFNESVEINWNLQLLGSDPDNTTIQGVAGPAVTISGTVGTKVAGFTLIGAGASPVGVHVTGGSSGIELSRNLIKDNTTGVLFDGRSSGSASFNTIISNTTGILVDGRYNWVDADSNLISNNDFGLYGETSIAQVVIDTLSGQTITDTIVAGAIFSLNNLLNNTVDYTNVITGPDDVIGVDPLFSGAHAYLTLGSPAIDAGNPLADVPSGGGIVADIGWHELRIPPISVLMGQADDSVATESYGVGSAEYAIVAVAVPTSPITSTLPSTWTAAVLDNPGEKLSYWEATFTPTSTGYYRIYSRATDGLGNTETNSTDWYDGAFYVDDTAPTVSFSYAAPDDMGVENTWLRLTGVVTDYVNTSFDIEDVYFTVDGVRYEARWSLDGWEADGVSGRSFHAIYMNDTGATQLLDIQAFAVDGAGQVGQSALESDVPLSGSSFGYSYFDSTGPRVTSMLIDDGYDTLLPPFSNNSLYTGTITFEGTAIDASDFGATPPNIEAFTGINGYQISFDGGLTWDTMERTVNPLFNNTHNGRILPFDWVIPRDLDATTIPVKIRATDYDGNSQVFVYTVTVDTGAPRMIGTINLESGPAQGQHLDQTTFLDLSWATPTDGSGILTQLGTFGQTGTDVPPSFVLPESSEARTVDVSEGGYWYAVVGAEDEVGNIDWMWVGPWYAGQVIDPDAPNGLPWSGAKQSVDFTLADGIVDLEHNEFVVENEWLDTDTRSGAPLSLYNAWGSGSSYLGVVGADWDTDGTFFVYYDLKSGGTTQPITQTGSIVLPFSADYALTFPGNGAEPQSWTFNGSAWEEDWSYLDYGVDAASKGMQIGRYFGGFNNLEQAANHRMMAYAVDDSGDVWATFPRNNSLSGAFENYFDWNVTPGSNPSDLLQRPTNAQLSDLTMAVASDPISAATLSHGDTMTVVVDLLALANQFTDTASGVQLQLTGSAGVNYQTVSGATCSDCAAADSWLLNVPTMTAGVSQIVTVTAVLDADLTGLTAVTNTVALIAANTGDSIETITHQLDLTPPTVAILPPPGYVIGSGPDNVGGRADDADGSGIALVEVSEDELSWRPATHTVRWTTVVTPTGSHNTTMMLYARATDLHGQVSDVVSATLVIDEVAPIITTTVPALVGGAPIVRLVGVASDPSPTDAQVAEVQIKIDSAKWQAVNLNIADAGGESVWWYQWLLPKVDGVQHTIQYRAYDYAGNVVTTTTPFTTVVDTIAPVIDTPRQFTEIAQGSNTPILGGTVSDGVGVAALTVTIYPATGAPSVITPTLAGDDWSVSMSTFPLGQYNLFVQATDTTGNVRVDGPYPVTIGAQTCYVEQVDSGWALVSIPVDANDATVAALFPDLTTPVYEYEYDTGYTAVTELEPGKSYWAKFDTPASYAICGQPPVASTTINVTAGWNLIGGFENTIDVATISATPGVIESPFFGYDNGYFSVTALQPGQGYWVRVSAAGTLSWSTLQAGPPPAQPPTACTPDWEAAITVSDASSGSQSLTIGVASGASAGYDAGCDTLAPPPPPGGTFDGRLKTTTEDVVADYLDAAVVWTVAFAPVTGAEPVTLSWSPSQFPGGGNGFYIQDRITGSVIRQHMAESNSIAVTMPLSDLEIVYETPTAVTLTNVTATHIGADSLMTVGLLLGLVALSWVWLHRRLRQR